MEHFSENRITAFQDYTRAVCMLVFQTNW
jgi:hypothetical protein